MHFMIYRGNGHRVLRGFKDKQLIKVVVGIRRAGKSILLEQFREALLDEGVPQKNVMALNFEEAPYVFLDTWQSMYAYIEKRLSPDGMNYIFLDEVQNVPNFQRAVDALFVKKNCDVYITGSNAYLLSGELATLLSGRYVEIQMMPLSFAEYCAAYPEEKNYEQLYRDYLDYSSFPYALQLEKDEELVRGYLDGVYNTIIVKDVISRSSVTNISQFESILRFMFDNIGNLVSVKKITDTLTSDGRKISAHTVESYLDAICAAFIFYKASRYDIKGKQYLKSGEKYYAADVTLRKNLLGNKFIDRGFILENIVYLELRRRGYKVYVGKIGEWEVDFVAEGKNGREYFQVCETMRGKEVRERELRGLDAIRDHNPKYVLCLDNESVIDYNGIKQIYALDWLLKG